MAIAMAGSGASAQGLVGRNQAAVANIPAANAAAQAQAASAARTGGLAPGAIAALQRQLSLQARNQAAIQAFRNAQNSAHDAAVAGPNFLLNSNGKPLAAVPNGVGKGALDPANGAGNLYFTDAAGNPVGPDGKTVYVTGPGGQQVLDGAGKPIPIKVPYAGQSPVSGVSIHGTNPVTDANGNAQVAFQGASGLDQVTNADGSVLATVHQNTPQAVFSWNSFNIGKETTLSFDQGGNRGWVALNRVVNSVAPNQILGRIKADGQVYIVNSNGILFGGSSQINLKALVASSADLPDSQFLTKNNGLYNSITTGSSVQGNLLLTYLPSFTGARGSIQVQGGAQITTNTPPSTTEAGGFVLLLGTNVTNAGTIVTPLGQTELAAGDSFILRPGLGDANSFSTTRGNEIEAVVAKTDPNGVQLKNFLGVPLYKPGPGSVTNSGLIQSSIGDITLSGQTITQGGVLLSSTTVNTRGTIHLLNSVADGGGSVTLSPGSITSIDLVNVDETGKVLTAFDSKRATLLANSVQTGIGRSSSAAPTAAVAPLDNLSLLTDRQDLSRIEIVTGGTVEFQKNALALANGGQVAVTGIKRIQVDSGATIDVSGSNVVLPASSNQLDLSIPNQLDVSIQGNELRDSPVNRDTGLLNTGKDTVPVDKSQLVFVPAGTGGYPTDRYYTRGGLLEVSGYVGKQAHTIGEYTSLGGTVTLGTAGSLVAQPGSVFDISGGSISYARGPVAQAYLAGADGSPYNINTAPAALKYTGIYKGFADISKKWGITQTFGNTLSLPAYRIQDGYTVGRDAGSLILATPTSVFEGQIAAAAINGALQTNSRTGTPQPAGALADPYLLSQTAAALPGALSLGLFDQFGFNGSPANVVFENAPPALAASIAAASAPIPTSRVNTAYFDTGQIDSFGLAKISISTTSAAAIASPLTLAPGGALSITSPSLDIAANVTARGGSVTTGNVVNNTGMTFGGGAVTLEPGVTVDTRGLWTNLALDTANVAGEAYANGGSVAFNGSTTLSGGSLIDASSGGILLANGQLKASGQGGDITLASFSGASTFGSQQVYPLVLKGTLRSQGVTKGGALTLGASTSAITIGDGLGGGTVAPGQIVLPTSFFAQGFSNYTINGGDGVTIAPGTVLNVAEPVFVANAGTAAILTGADTAAALSLILPQRYTENAAKRTLAQRAGAGLALQTNLFGKIGITIGQGAVLNLDPGQAFSASTPGQITVAANAQIHAPGGSIALSNATTATGNPQGLSTWVGENAVLDVAGRAVTALDIAGNPYGIAPKGGSVFIGRVTDQGTQAASDAFVVLRPGAVIDASGSSVTVAAGAPAGLNQPVPRLTIASDGGSIGLSSYSGIYNDGTLRAPKGGLGASGGSLTITLEDLITQSKPIEPDYNNPRVLTVSQNARPSGLSAGLTPGAIDPTLMVGQAAVSQDLIAGGGFDTVSLLSKGAIVFDGNVALKTGRGIRLAGTIAERGLNSTASIDAPYILFGYTIGEQSPNSDGATHTPAGYVPGSADRGTFSANASLIDIKNGTGFSAFSDVSLTSTGDIRLTGGDQRSNDSTPPIGSISTASILTLTAAQIYPASGTTGVLSVTGPNGVLTFARTGNSTPAAPSSVFGNLTLNAATINQGGVIRAPEGNIAFGPLNYGGTVPNVVNLLPGSITSVGTNGFDIPYGGSADGVTYNVGGSGSAFSLSSSQLGFNARSVAISQGATVDLSGGGALLGASFISGRGGSVDALASPFLSFNAAAGTYSAPKLSTNPVYAILPGPQGTAPQAAFTDTGYKGSIPSPGDQVTILDGGIPGLAAGTYTLLPSNYALLPGAFRVEIGAATNAPVAAAAAFNGSYTVSGYRSIANTAIVSSQPNVLTVTPGATVRTLAQYKETTYDAFALQTAQTLGQSQPALFTDAKNLNLTYSSPFAGLAFANAGTVLTSPGLNGRGAVVSVATNGTDLEVVGAAPTPGFVGTSVAASGLTALNADTLLIGGTYGGGSSVTLGGNGYGYVSPSVSIRDGAVLGAPNVLLTAAGQGGGATGAINIDAGAVIDTLAYGDTTRGLANGVVYQPTSTAVAISNGQIVFTSNVQGLNSGPITIADDARLYSKGSIAFNTAAGLNLGAGVRYGTKNIAISSSNVNIGTSATLASATVPDGLVLTSDILTRLLNGNAALGVPKLESLSLTAQASVNFFGTVNLSTIDPMTGKSSLTELDVNAPGIYGYGAPGDIATLTTGKFVWNGVFSQGDFTGRLSASASAPASISNGPGSGTGILNVFADTIVFGYPSLTQPQKTIALQRTTLGFSTVNLTGTTEITSNNNGTLGVYRSQYYDSASNSFKTTGGDLNLKTPLLTGDNGSILKISAGGALALTNPSGVGANLTSVKTLGATLDLQADSISLNSAIDLPSGSLSVLAAHNIDLGTQSQISLAGSLNALAAGQANPGGVLSFESTSGNITQFAGSTVDLSPASGFNNGGSVTFSATSAGAGIVSLNGALRGGLQGSSFGIAAQNFADFDALNAKLNAGGFDASRSFDLKQGSITVSDATGLKARAIEVSVDAGSLLVTGKIDASGDKPGSIRLAASNNLTLASTAFLDAHGNVLQTDFYGQAIAAKNKGTVELTASNGLLALNAGAKIDLAIRDKNYPNAASYGQVTLNASRTSETGNDIKISAPGPFDIQGAKSIALNGYWKYNPDGGVFDQSYLAGIDATNRTFIQNVSSNSDFLNNPAAVHTIAGLTSYGSAFHLRPGVEIGSSGDLTVSGDLDLSTFRYGPQGRPQTEPGTLLLRASGNLKFTGTVNDGFDTTGLPANGVSTFLGRNPTDGSNGIAQAVIVGAAGVVLPKGTQFTAGARLGFDLPISGAQQANYSKIDPASLASYDDPMSALNTTGVVLSADFVANTGSGKTMFFAQFPSGYTLPNGNTFFDTSTDPLPPTLKLPAGTKIFTDDSSLFFLGKDAISGVDLIAAGGTGPGLQGGSVLPVSITLAASHTIVSSFTATGRIADANGNTLFAPGTYVKASLTAPVVLAAGDQLGAGVTLPVQSTGDQFDNPYSFAGTIVWPAGVPLSFASIQNSVPVSLDSSVSLGGGSVIPAGTSFPNALTFRTGIKNYSAAPFQPSGTQSWSYRFVGGADTAAADSRTTAAASLLNGSGNVTLSDPHAAPSYIRTGTGTLDILAGGNYSQSSLYGIYTAGTQLSVNPATGAPGFGAQTGYAVDGGGDVLISVQRNLTSFNSVTGNYPLIADQTGDVGQWLWRQAGAGVPTAWGINFSPSAYRTQSSTVFGYGFNGFGALGGGNLTIVIGGDAGANDPLNVNSPTSFNAAIGGSGYVSTVKAGDKITLVPVQTGGGTLMISVRGALNPSVTRPFGNSVPDPGALGTITNLRGDVKIDAGRIGSVGLDYGQAAAMDTRAPDPFAPLLNNLPSGPNLYLGDAAAHVIARGDLSLTVVGNPGTVSEVKPGGSTSLFSLWTDRTAIGLTSLGGNVNTVLGSGTRPNDFGQSFNAAFVPPTVSEIAETGSLSVGGSFEVAPSFSGQLSLIAGGSIFGGGYPIVISGADPASVATIFAPSPGAIGFSSTIITHGPDTPTFNLHANDTQPIKISAATGDIINLRLDDQAKFADIHAGRDILGVNAFILNDNKTDISTITAGRDIFYANAKIAGPGLLDVEAGRNVYQGAQGQLESVGVQFNVDQNSRSGGAGITVLAGVGTSGPDYAAFARLYLDPANLADPKLPLSSQPGKVAQNYDGELLTWLQGRFASPTGFAAFTGATPADAYAYFKMLPAAQQEVFVRQIYFAELTAGGREYNNPQSPRFKSYARSREAIATLFPSVDGKGNPIVYRGDLTEFYSSTLNTGSFIRTDFGGDIQTFTPGGQTLIGVEGAPPGPNAGFLTQGQGNIDIFSRDSILLGQSRVFTTFGGSILAYSEQGDINAGRGSKTTQIYSPPKRISDNYGNITLSPAVPTTGAGFATLTPIPEILPGDIDLIAPLGTVDPGEAGIRVSGNINIAALFVLNANNIQVQGTSTGIPVATPVNTGALTSAGNTTAAAVKDAAPAPRRETRQSIIIVEILGFGGSEGKAESPRTDCPGGVPRVGGNCPIAAPANGQRGAAITEPRRKSVRVLGAGQLTDGQKAILTPEEREQL